MFRQSALAIIIVCLSAPGRGASAHGGHSHETDGLAAEVFAKTLQLAPEIFAPRDHVSFPFIKVRGRKLFFSAAPAERAAPLAGGPSAEAGGSHDSLNGEKWTDGEAAISLNSQFWILVEYWLRLYHNELSGYCPCEWDPGQLAAESREAVYQGFFQAKIGKPAASKLVGMAETGYDLGARYGKAAMALQIAAEAAETVLLKGNHLLCKLNNVLAFALIRQAQRLFRLTGHAAGPLDESRLLMAARWGWTARAVRKAQRKVQFHLMSAALDEEALPQVNHEGYKSRREKWLRKIARKTGPLIERRRELGGRIAEEEASFAAASAFVAGGEGGRKEKRAARRVARKAAKAAQKAAGERDGLNDKIGSITELSGKTYLGRRIGLSLWLFSRKGRPRFLQGETKADKPAAAGGWLYALAASENIMERAFLRELEAFFEGEGGPAGGRLLDGRPLDSGQSAEGPPAAGLLPGASLTAEAGIQRGLAKEFAAELKQAGLTLDEEGAAFAAERLLSDVARIFDPSRPLFERYALHSIMEAALAGFFPHYIDIFYKRIAGLQDPSVSRGRRLRIRLNIRSALSGFVYHVHQYFDWTRAAALAKNEAALVSLKYESMEGLLRLLRYLADLAPVAASAEAAFAARGGGERAAEELLNQLRANGAKAAALQPWRERRTAFSWFGWIPFSKPPLPRCRDLLKKPEYY